MADHHCKIAWVYNKYNSRSKIYHKQRICYRGYSHFEAKALNNVWNENKAGIEFHRKSP